MKINKLNKVFIVLIAILFVTIGFLSYYTQELKADNSKLITSKFMLQHTLADTNKLSNTIQLENIELKKELEELKE
jgi:hypothetical protein